MEEMKKRYDTVNDKLWNLETRMKTMSKDPAETSAKGPNTLAKGPKTFLKAQNPLVKYPNTTAKGPNTSLEVSKLLARQF